MLAKSTQAVLFFWIRGSEDTSIPLFEGPRLPLYSSPCTVSVPDIYKISAEMK